MKLEKLEHEERELGEHYIEEPGWFYHLLLISVVLGLAIVFAERTGLVDHLINSIQ